MIKGQMKLFLQRYYLRLSKEGGNNVPTENMQGILPGKNFFEDQDGDIKELCTYESKEENNDDAVNAMEYAAKCITEGETSMTIELPKDRTRQILKMTGLERITRKRFKKLLMGCGMQRNDAEVIAEQFCNEKIPYTPLGVQQVIETIIKEIKEEQ